VRGDRESKGNHLKFSKEVRRRQKSCSRVGLKKSHWFMMI